MVWWGATKCSFELNFIFFINNLILVKCSITDNYCINIIIIQLFYLSAKIILLFFRRFVVGFALPMSRTSGFVGC